MPQQDVKQPQQPNREGRSSGSYDKGAQPFTQDKNVKGSSNRDLGNISDKRSGMDQDVHDDSTIGNQSSNR